MAQKKGWKPLPTSLKVLFVILILMAVHSLFYIDLIYQGGASILGFHILGIGAVISYIILTVVGVIVLLFALWNRFNWAWKYGVAYFAFFILNNLINLINLPKQLELLISQLPAVVPGAVQIVYISAVGGLLFVIVLHIIFLIILYKKRSYFE